MSETSAPETTATVTKSAPRKSAPRKSAASVALDLSSLSPVQRAAVESALARTDPSFAVSAILSGLRAVISAMESAGSPAAALSAAAPLGGLYQRANALRAAGGETLKVGRPRKA